jgi:branched-chain amino acid transport system permease protein
MDLIPILIQGLLLGSLYGLAASGLSFVFGVMTIINLSHAEFIMLGAYVTFYLYFFFDFNPFLSIPISMLCLGCIAIIIYRVAIIKVAKESQLVSLILTFAISTFLWNLAQVVFSSTFRSVPYSLGSIRLIETNFAVNKVISFAIVSVIITALHLFLKWTKIGRAIRAVSQNAKISSISGIDVDKIRMIGFGLGGALAAVAGSLIAIQWSIFPLMGQDLILKCFAIVAIGGLGSLPGAFLGGIILGIAESVGTSYWDATMANVIAPLLLIVTFLFRPQGLLGQVEKD